MRPTPRKPERPVLWIIAGPNGCGKSSFYNRTDIDGWGGSVWIINPDLLTEEIAEREGLSGDVANLEAVKRIEDWLDSSVQVYQTIGVETVLSSSKYRALVQRAKQRGFELRIIYIVLASAELQLERVALRVAEGGHHVPADKVMARRQRSSEQLAWFSGEADACYIYDNSTGKPELLGSKAGQVLLLWDRFPADLDAVLRSAGVPLLQLYHH